MSVGMPRLGLPWRITRRFLRDRRLWASSLIVLVVAAFLTATFVSLTSLTLSGAQIVERDLGKYTSLANLSGLLPVAPGDPDLLGELNQAGNRAGATGFESSLTSVDVRPAVVDPPFTFYREMNWQAQPFPQRLKLNAGRWPEAPGEIAVADPQTLNVQVGDTLAILAGHVRLKVVGLAEDRYAGFPSLLAASGTWAEMNPSALKAFPDTQAWATAYWTHGDPARISTELAKILGQRQRDLQRSIAPGTTGNSRPPQTVNSVSQLRRAITTATSTQDQISRTQEDSALTRIPAGYTIPALLFPPLAVLALFTLNERRYRRSLTIMQSVGTPRRTAAAGIGTAIVITALGAGLLGCLAGLLAGLSLRPLIQHFRVQPISPPTDLHNPLLHILGLTLATGIVATILMSRPRPAKAHTDTAAAPASTILPTPPRGRWVSAPRWVAFSAACATIPQLSQMTSPPRAMVLTATVGLIVLLLIPDLVTAVLQIDHRSGPRWRLARRQLLGERSRAVSMVIILTAALGAPLGLLTLFSTMIATGNNAAYSDVSHGQVALGYWGSILTPPSPGLVQAAGTTSLATRNSTQIHLLTSDDGTEQVHIHGTTSGLILAVDTPTQAAELLAQTLTPAQTQTLQQGGALTWDTADRPAGTSIRLDKTTNDEITTTSPAIPAQQVVIDPVRWKQSTSALVLTSSAKTLDLPTRAVGLLYTGIDDHDAAVIQKTILAAGQDPHSVLVYQPPEPWIPTPAMWAAGIAQTLLIFLISTTAIRSQTRSLRGYLASLITIGVPTRWARQVLLAQYATIIALSITCALLISVPPVTITGILLPGYTLDIPWLLLATLIGAFTLATLATTLVSARTLKAAERTT